MGNGGFLMNLDPPGMMGRQYGSGCIHENSASTKKTKKKTYQQLVIETEHRRHFDWMPDSNTRN
jgi:hypothetical protein